MDELSKFDELRRKTDNELVHVFTDDLRMGLAAARKALKSTDDLASARESYLRAKRAYTEVSRLLPVTYEITENERIGLQLRLTRLRAMLDTLSRLDYAHHPSEKDMAALVTAR
jgi:hypothetical protein